MNKHLVNAIIEKSTLFKNSNKEFAEELLQSLKVESYLKGDFIFKTHQKPDFVFIMVEGRVAVYIQDEFITDRKEYEIVGEQSVIEDKPPLASVMVISEVAKIVKIKDEKFRQYIKKDIQIALNLLKIVSEKLRYSSSFRAELLRNGKKLEKEIKRRKQAEEKLRHIAHYDLLTKLPNRFLLYDRLESALRQVERYNVFIAVMFIDLDDFKMVNDTYGHTAGDKVLMEASNRIRRCIRKSDTVARIGGDEFVVLMIDYGDNHNPKVVAERIIKALAEPYTIDGEDPINTKVTTSIGIAVCNKNDCSADALINKADSAMYRAKKLGKNNYQFYD
jgi:diguanylate cyclase (GGDEF)-like protein